MIALDVDDVGVGIFLADAVGDGIQQVGFAHAGRAIKEQGIVHLPRRFGNGDGCAVGETVGGADNEVVKGKLGIEVHGRNAFPLLFEGVQLFVTEDHQLRVGIEHFLQRVLNVIGAAAADNLPAEIRGGVQNQIVLVQLHHLGIVEPCRNGDSPQPLFHMAQNLCPHIGR